MARLTNVNERALRKTPGRHRVGDGLFLRVLDAERAYWCFRYRFGGKEREVSIGPAHKLTLAEARDKHLALRKQVKVDKVDPVAQKRASKAAIEDRPDVPTFGKCADAYLAAHEASWRNPKHRQQWRQTLNVYCAPIRALPVDRIDAKAVLSVLTPIWTRVPETASRLRGRIEAVLNAARVLGHISADKANPARWRGWLDQTLPKPKKLDKQKGDERVARGHHAALQAGEVPALMRDLKALDTIGARAAMFTILCATRTNETLGATWNEVDFDKAVWIVPASRSKVKKDFRVPLAPQAIDILRRQEAERGKNPFLFPGLPRRPLSSMAMLMILRRLEIPATMHGIARSTFRDWAQDEAGFDRSICEMALGHALGAVEGAYRRGDAFYQRRELMHQWGRFCIPSDAQIIPFQRIAE
jgi:integrase